MSNRFTQSLTLATLALLLLFSGCGDDDGPAKPEDGLQGTPTFTKTAAFGMGVSVAAEWADYDGDTDIDFAVGNHGQNFLYTNDGNGSFTETVNFGAGQTWSLLWMNTDGDSDLDLVVGNAGQNFIYVNEGGGVFSEVAALDWGGTALASGDLDGDADADIVGATWPSSTAIFMNSGENNFVFDSVLPRAASAAIFDVDKDNDLDIVLGGGCCSDSSWVYTNNGSGEFLKHSSFGSAEDEMTNFSWSDYDNDGDLDLVSGCGDNGGEYLGLWIYDNDGAGNFTPSVLLAEPIYYSRVLFGDVDGDNDDDVVVGTAGFGHDRLAVYFNNAGTFSKKTVETGGATSFPFNGAVNAIALADVDQDSDVDIAVFRMDWVSEFSVEPAQNSLFVNEGP